MKLIKIISCCILLMLMSFPSYGSNDSCYKVISIDSSFIKEYYRIKLLTPKLDTIKVFSKREINLDSMRFSIIGNKIKVNEEYRFTLKIIDIIIIDGYERRGHAYNLGYYIHENIVVPIIENYEDIFEAKELKGLIYIK